MPADPTTPVEVIVAVASVTTATMAVLTGFVAVISLRGVRRDSRQRSRPAMIARLEPAVLSHSFIDLIIENRGASIARDVSINFVPPLPTTGILAPYMTRRYAKPISAIAPGQQLFNVYGRLADEGAPGEFEEDVPTVLEVQFRYTDDNDRPFVDTFQLDAAVLADLTHATRDMKSDSAALKLQAEALEAIARAIGRV